MPQRDISDLIQRKTSQIRYFDNARLRAASSQGALGHFLTYKDYIDVVRGGIVEFNTSGNITGCQKCGSDGIIKIIYIDFTTGKLVFTIDVDPIINININNITRDSFIANYPGGEYTSSFLKINSLGGNIALTDNISFSSPNTFGNNINETPFNTYSLNFVNYVVSQTNIEELQYQLERVENINAMQNTYNYYIELYNNSNPLLTRSNVYYLNIDMYIDYQTVYDDQPIKLVNLQKIITYLSNNNDILCNCYNLLLQSIYTFSNSIDNLDSAINRGSNPSITTFVNQALEYSNFNNKIDNIKNTFNNTINNIYNYYTIISDPQYDFLNDGDGNLYSATILYTLFNLSNIYFAYNSNYSNFIYDSMLLTESLDSANSFTLYSISFIDSLITEYNSIYGYMDRITSIMQELREQMQILNTT